ncbi:MAG: hypothetical protein U1F65_06955 [Verrucomicrobiota bacterium]
MKLPSLLCLGALALLVTGCPHNDYTVELTPRQQAIERKLVFFRADGMNTNGMPNYQSFPSNELASISALYQNQVTKDGKRHLAHGEFTENLPADIGGKGSYHWFSNSLGSAGIYAERFRGNDDLAARTQERLAAADQLADLILGWSRAEFGREPHYKELRQFLDTHVRRDLKNLALHLLAGEAASSVKPDSTKDFLLRFAQYLHERGYWRVEDAPLLARIQSGGHDGDMLLLIKRVFAEKLGAAPSLAIFDDTATTEASWKKHLAGTDAYRTRFRQWQKAKKTDPELAQPEPAAVANDLMAVLVDSGSSGEDDQLTVRLHLAGAPDHTNGKWEETRQQVVWESPLEPNPSARRLPVFCYASWTQPSRTFQESHFGRVILRGDDLLKYCLWQKGLQPADAAEWERHLGGLKPGQALTNRFEFSTEADFGRDLIRAGLESRD